MSNFPTAFWKRQPASEPSLSISWETGLAWSRGDGVSQADVNTPLEGEVCCACPAPSCKTTFPFKVGDDEYYDGYQSATWVGDTSYLAAVPYYAWFLTGGYDVPGENDLSAYHQANPWTIHSSGIRIDFEADWDTAALIGDTIAGSRSIAEGYNSFVQSGSATGTFNISIAEAPATLVVKASGLGEDYTFDAAPSYDIMTVHLDDTLICSGKAPMDDRDVVGLGNQNYDMQQVKLYAGADLETIVNYQVTPTTNLTKGEPRGRVNVEVGNIENFTSDHNNGTYTNVSLSGGSGEDIKATVVVGASVVTSVTITDDGTGYEIGDVLTIPSISTGGSTPSNCTVEGVGLVRQLVRESGYTTDDGVGTFTKTNLAAGEYKIKINVSTIDGVYNSGAFYGVNFNLT